MNNNKVILVILGVVVLFIAVMGYKIMSASTNGGVGEQISLTTDPNPPSMGPVNLIIMVKDDKGNLVKDATVAFDLNMTAMNMGTQQGTATPQGDGTYAATGRLSMRGPWKVSTNVVMPDGKQMNKDFTINAQ